MYFTWKYQKEMKFEFKTAPALHFILKEQLIQGRIDCYLMMLVWKVNKWGCTWQSGVTLMVKLNFEVRIVNDNAGLLMCSWSWRRLKISMEKFDFSSSQTEPLPLKIYLFQFIWFLPFFSISTDCIYFN
jgi:hypothetical protein